MQYDETGHQEWGIVSRESKAETVDENFLFHADDESNVLNNSQHSSTKSSCLLAYQSNEQYND